MSDVDQDTNDLKNGLSVTKLYDGLVIYTDGSSDAKGGSIGWAAHGYIYSKEEPKKTPGNGKVVPTVNGYRIKSEHTEPNITIHGYVDIIGATQKQGTNNTAEAAGLLSALNFAKDYRFKKILIRPDSEYAINGCSKWMRPWAAQGWRKRTGEPVANADVWRQVLSVYDIIDGNDTKIDFKWVKGHSGEHGNVSADKLASVARQRSKQGEEKVEVIVKHEAVDSKTTAKKNNLIFHPGILFKTLKGSNPNGLIFTNSTKVEEMVGRNDTDAVVVYAELEYRDPVIDIIIVEQIKAAPELESTVMLNYRRLYSGDRASDILEHKGNVLTKSIGHRNDFYYHTDDSWKKDPKKRQPITQDLYPPMLIDRTWLFGHVMRDTLELVKQYYADPSKAIEGGEIIDITNILYKKLDKPSKEDFYELMPIFKSNTREFSIRHQCRGIETDYRLVVNMHLPAYPTCKGFTKSSEVKVYLVLRHISENAERYSVVIKAGDNWLSIGAYSANLVVHANPLVQ